MLTPHGLLKNGILTLDPEGFITDIDSREGIDSLAGVSFYSGILIPGMVNAHTHLELSYLRGAIAEGTGFSGFAAGISANRELTTVDERVRAADYWDAKMWSEGVGAVGDICNSAFTFPVKSRSLIRYHSFAELFGLDVDSLAPVDEVVRTAHEAGQPCTVTPHATYSLGEKAFALAVGEAGNSPLSIHFMESAAEQQLFYGSGYMYEWYVKRGFDPDFLHFGSPTGRIIKQVPSERPVLLIHNTRVTEEVVRRLTEHFGDRVTFVLCPRSNDYIEGARPPVELLRRMGVQVALGTDSLASNTSLSMIEEMKDIKGAPLEEILQWATLNGARALGLDGELGSFEVGKRPGVVQLTGVDYQTMTLGENAMTKRIV